MKKRIKNIKVKLGLKRNNVFSEWEIKKLKYW